MTQPPLPIDEDQRLHALRRTNLLNTPREAVLDHLVQLAADVLDTPFSLITLLDEQHQWFKSKIGTELEKASRTVSFCAYAIHQERVSVVPDATADTRFADNPCVTGEPHIRFYAGTPLTTPDGYRLGTLCVLDTSPRHDFGERECRLLEQLGSIANAWLSMREAAGYLDAETGVYTRQRLLETLQGERAKPTPALDAPRRLLVVLDVAIPRQMEELTQVMGYAQTEQFVVECINRLAQAIGGERDLYRIGIFRFGFRIEEYAGTRVAERLRALIEVLREPFDSGVGILLSPKAAIGVADLDEQAHDTAEDILRHASIAADDACDSAAGWAFYRPDSEAHRQRKFQLLTDLPAALSARDQLYLEYQPKVDLVTGECRSVEALLRWNHPILGRVSPVELIEAAEKTALMRPLTDWVLNAALTQCREWHSEGTVLEVAVNLSAYDLADDRLLSRVAEALDRHALAGNSLELEFTESALIRDLDAMIPKLRSLHELGVSTAIDDFGTGYCNLAYLQKLNSSKIKLDRGFVQMLDEDPRDRALTRAIVNMAHEMNYKIVAEGVETESTRDLLIEWGCEQAQGYLFSKPLSAQRVPEWIRHHRLATDNARTDHGSHCA